MDMGCDGFRVDMADSLVKGDDDKHATARVWQDILGAVKSEYPDSVFVSEWSNPYVSVGEAGFDMDFYLNHAGNGYNFLLRDYDTPGEDLSYFRSGSCVSCKKFMDQYMPAYEAIREKGYISLISGNHDTPRISHNLSAREQKIALSFLFTMPGVPFLYYGDEIGMRYLDLPSFEGGYTRTGSRTPMQWDDKTLSSCLYLPCDSASDAPTVASQLKVHDSMLNTVRSILSIRNNNNSLNADSSLEILFCNDNSPLLIYRRGDLKIAVNPSVNEVSERTDIGTCKPLWSIGEGRCEDGIIRMKPQSFVIFK